MQFLVRPVNPVSQPPLIDHPGFSFSGEVREPFPAVIQALQETRLPVTSVDAPSSWDIEEGPPKSGPGSTFMPTVLVSLTAPKPLVKYYTGRHFIGGRYVILVSTWFMKELLTFVGLSRRLSQRSTISTFLNIKVSIR